MKITVRQYQPSDRHALPLLEAGCPALRRHTFTPAKKRRRRADRRAARNLLIAESGEYIVGVAQRKQHRFRSILHVRRLLTAQDVNAPAIRLALLRPILADALAQDIDKVTIAQDLSNHELQTLNTYGWHTLRRGRGNTISCYPDLYTPHENKLRALIDPGHIDAFLNHAKPTREGSQATADRS